MNSSLAKRFLILNACLLAVACVGACSTTSERFVLLPEPDGSAGAIAVRSATHEQLIDHAYSGVSVSATGNMEQTSDTKASVLARYGSLLAAQPPRPVTYTIYMLPGGTEGHMAEPYVTMQKIRTTLATWPAPHIVVAGHSAQPGSRTSDERSLREAQAVTAFLIREGIPASEIETVGSGDTGLLSGPPDSQPSVANRRVDVTIR